ncbi:MAG TPA: hypothetical protein DDW50_00720 [Firmicutes bacterium]|nr:hypothetical protein [Bacillota bacterium]
MKNSSIPNQKGMLEAIPAITATFIGTVVGAGFASGQEILRFFGIYGTYGFIGIITAVFLMGLAGVRIFQVGQRQKPTSYYQFLLYILGEHWTPIVDFLFLVFFIILIGVMLAGSGALFESLGANYWTGEILTSLLLIGVLFCGLTGLISANLIVIPLMFVGSLSISFYGLWTQSAVLHTHPFNVGWFLAALQFSAYNIVLAMPVLLALSQEYTNLSHLKYGSWLGSLGLGLMAGFMQWALLCHFSQLGNSDLPMIELARGAGRIPYWGYAVILWGEMFTTLLANTYGLAKRLILLCGWSYRIWVVFLTIVGLFISQIGFINLIAGCYPLFGFLSLIILVSIFWKTSKKVKIVKK